jgi:hypothetical protein
LPASVDFNINIIINTFSKGAHMSEQRKKAEEGKTIAVVVGQPVQINLQSMAGSTGYGWYLTRLDGGLALSSTAVIPTAQGIAPVSHQFSFIATKAGSYNVVFDLLAPWRPTEIADSETYVVTISEPRKTAKEDIEAGMAGRQFLKTSSASVGQQTLDYSTVLKYAAPMVQSALPQSIIYAAPMTRIPDPWGNLAAATMIAYAAPVGPTMVAATGYAAKMADPCLQNQCQPQYNAMIQPYAAPWPNAQLLYAAPMAQSGQCQCPQPMYAAPMSQPLQPLYAAPMVMRYAAPYYPGCTC